MICGGPGVSDAYYCKECTIQEKDVSSEDFFSWAVAIILFIVNFHRETAVQRL